MASSQVCFPEKLLPNCKLALLMCGIDISQRKLQSDDNRVPKLAKLREINTRDQRGQLRQEARSEICLQLRTNFRTTPYPPSPALCRPSLGQMRSPTPRHLQQI